MPSVDFSNIKNETLSPTNSNKTFEIERPLQTMTPLSFKVLTTTAQSPSPRNGLSGGQIAGIVSGVIGFFIVFALIYYCYRRQKRHKPSSSSPVTPPAKPSQPNPIVSPPSEPPIAHTILQCRQPLCEEYLKRFKIPDAFFNKKYDKCFCRKCHSPSDKKGTCGHWCNELHRWTRFGLSINDAHAKQWKIFRDWKTSYYGTTSDRLFAIIRNRFVPLDNDQLADGKLFISGHADKTHCNTSPSLMCASQPKFSAPSRFRAPDGNNYNVQVVLQCKQNPDTIIGDKSAASSTRGIVWKTQARCTVVPYALFIRLQKL
ncbi:hypothetical protein I4U23_010449 [Adineta vaga]|nr:hypothetical protein I4U23_010449 [Adineta vaga]